MENRESQGRPLECASCGAVAVKFVDGEAVCEECGDVVIDVERPPFAMPERDGEGNPLVEGGPSEVIEAPSVRSKPGIGIIVTGEMTESVFRTIVRAGERGYRCFVISSETTDQNDVQLVERLGATHIEYDLEQSDFREVIQRLSATIKEAELPGLIYLDAPTEEIDYERSEMHLRNESSDVVQAVTKEDHITPSHLIVGIPAYNEEVAIGSVVLKTKLYADEVVVVDDGSNDDTARIAHQAGATVIKRDTNSGKGAAIKTLFDHASMSECDVLVVLDGDGQHDPSDIQEVIGPILDGDADLVIGSRYLDESPDHDTPRYRRFGQRILDTLTFGTARTRVNDSQSGFRAFSPTALETLDPQAHGYEVEIEMINQAVNRGLSIAERPIGVRYEGVDGSTQHPIKHGFSIVGFVLRQIQDRHPLLFFGVPGTVLTVIGMVYGIDTILIYQNSGAFYPAKAMGSGVVTIIGVLGMFSALILNQIASTVSRLEETS